MKRSLLLLFFLVFGSIPAFAASYDFSDAPGYATATHSNPSWQRLGDRWDSESAPKASDTSDDGVFWSVDGGQTWGHDVITAGTTVTFRFDMYKQYWGRHSFDALRAWIDFNNDKDFTDQGELVYQDQWNFTVADINLNNPLYYEKGANYKPYRRGNTSGTGGDDGHGDYTADITKFFYRDITFGASLYGDYWLRARVCCNADIGSNFNNLTPTGFIGQGEVEDWKLTIAKPVPEPSTMLLLGTGLLGFAAKKRRKK
jgi:hypothetical protein